MANTIGMFETGSKRPGFHMTFTNGNTVSVQWGKYNYCNAETDNEHGEPTHFSKNAEIAAWDSEGNWYRFDSDDVLGYQSPEDVARFITFVATSTLTTDRWQMNEQAISDNKNRVTVTKICTKNDANGNPRRAWLVHNVPDRNMNADPTKWWPRCVAVVDEGYMGRGAIDQWLDKNKCIAYDLDIIKVGISEYNKFTNKKWTDVCDKERIALYGG